jgi:hypothetical protein
VAGAANYGIASVVSDDEIIIATPSKLLRGISREPDGAWKVDPGIAPLLGDVDPATAVKRVKRALAVVESVLAQRDERG